MWLYAALYFLRQYSLKCQRPQETTSYIHFALYKKRYRFFFCLLRYIDEKLFLFLLNAHNPHKTTSISNEWPYKRTQIYRITMSTAATIRFLSAWIKRRNKKKTRCSLWFLKRSQLLATNNNRHRHSPNTLNYGTTFKSIILHNGYVPFVAFFLLIFNLLLLWILIFFIKSPNIYTHIYAYQSVYALNQTILLHCHTNSFRFWNLCWRLHYKKTYTHGETAREDKKNAKNLPWNISHRVNFSTIWHSNKCFFFSSTWYFTIATSLTFCSFSIFLFAFLFADLFNIFDEQTERRENQFA